jgi:hypothetical protein
LEPGKLCNAGQSGRRTRAARAIARLIIVIAAGTWSCAVIQKRVASPAQSGSTAVASPSPSAETDATSDEPPPPGASIDISYSRPNDYLMAFEVVKYMDARPISKRVLAPGQESTIAILDGGVPVWQFHAEKGLLGDFGFDKSLNVKKVTYGVLPKNFVELMPESGPPEPLEPGHYYVFSVTRASGSQSQSVVKVNADGSLSAFAAQPLAGNSFEICCNLTPDFFSAASLEQ